ncbi:uncharacterized protein [Euphorbia lathyris]|uniref:uncharacterized protein n=1 Tax=Euphorbia lathyris TaxID=212925 RepID=UPI0033130A61
MASITIEELHAFHSMDREVFSRMVFQLIRDPAQTLLVMAMWLWLETIGYKNIVIKLVPLSQVLLNAIANEAVLCLKCLDPNLKEEMSAEIPLTSRLVDKELSLQMFSLHKFSAITGIKYLLNSVCSTIFTDMLQLVLGSSSSSSSQALVMPGFPHRVFGNVSILPRAVDFDFPQDELWSWNPSKTVSEDDRTMFLTFSRGFPVTREEVINLFSELIGVGVVDVKMQHKTPGNEQPLFGKMVLDSIASVDKILNGNPIAKFRIKGKHIWARKYERRE